MSTVNSSWLVIPNSASQHEPAQSATNDVANLDDVLSSVGNASSCASTVGTASSDASTASSSQDAPPRARRWGKKKDK